jgi:lipopolysaccharide export system protein LptA
LTIQAANTAVGSEDNVFIKTDSRIATGDKITVSLTAQTFTAKDATEVSSIPFTVKYVKQMGTTEDNSGTDVTTLASPVSILEQTGAQIAAITDNVETTTGADNISATVQALATDTQIVEADVSGVHTGTITFSVAKS